MGQVQPRRRLQNRGCKGGLDYWPHRGHPKIAWKLRRSSLHCGRPSSIFRGNFRPQALSSKFRRVRVRSSLQIKREAV
ncbi:hypothetical protein U9M48_003675 [Paspalum notatum var. saurae]|uniref:Uncharacterized protein n=1 Tax=Paspalum notatum var. saurae TaxID=547442 RepID=A0AAQ3PIT5_PASNO